MDSRHEHHVTVVDTSEPAGTLIWIHIAVQTLSWCILFPLGMVFGIKKSRWHVPLQSTTLVLSSAGYILGHHHGGREYPKTVHSPMAWVIVLMLVVQSASGAYLKTHLPRLRSVVVRIHGYLGRLYPLVGWTQMLFGVQTYAGLCLGEEAMQCYAHHTFGLSFILYGTLLTIAMYAGTGWIARRGKPQEFYDSLMIMTFGIINTFSMRHSDGWSHKDLQHTALGLLWWAGGSLGVFISWTGKRNFVPAMVFIMTGYAFGGHVQKMMISSMVHKILGYALGTAGIVRAIEIFFVLKDQPSGEGPDGEGVRGWQHLYPYLLVLVGCIFLSATDEELKAVDDSGLDGVTYMLIMFSLSFLIYLIVLALISAYTSPTFGVNPTSKNGFKDSEGSILPGGYQALRRRAGGDGEGAEEYELEDDGDALDVDDGVGGRGRGVDSFEEEMEGRGGRGRSGGRS